MNKIEKLKIVLDAIEDEAKEDLKKGTSLVDFKEGQLATIEIIRKQLGL